MSTVYFSTELIRVWYDAPGRYVVSAAPHKSHNESNGIKCMSVSVS